MAETKVQKTKPMSVSPAYDSMWDDPVEDFIGPKIPMLKAAQGGTENMPLEAKEGEFFNTATGEVYQNPAVLMLYIGKPRQALYKPYQVGVKKPLTCSSSDGIMPDGGDGMLPGPCRKKVGGRWIDACPKCSWGNKNEPPECTTLYTALLWILGSEQVVVHTFKRTSVKALRAVLTQRKAMSEKIVDKDSPDIHPKFLAPVKMYTERRANYHEVKLELLLDEGSRVPADYARNVMELTKGFVEQLDSMSTAEITETEAEVVGVQVNPDEAPY
jgi:hypothetical protein